MQNEIQIKGRKFKVEDHGKHKLGGRELHLFGERSAHYRTMPFRNEKNKYYLVNVKNNKVDPLGSVSITIGDNGRLYVGHYK